MPKNPYKGDRRFQKKVSRTERVIQNLHTKITPKIKFFRNRGFPEFAKLLEELLEDLNNYSPYEAGMRFSKKSANALLNHPKYTIRLKGLLDKHRRQVIQEERRDNPFSRNKALTQEEISLKEDLKTNTSERRSELISEQDIETMKIFNSFSTNLAMYLSKK